MSTVKMPPGDTGPISSIEPVTTLETLGIDGLRMQHQQLKQRLEVRQKQENDLRERIEQLEKRQTEDNAVMNVINRYWKQLNQDLRILLERFDEETCDESNNKTDENETTTTWDFLTQLSTWDKDELDQKLATRAADSTGAVTKIIQAFHRHQERHEKIKKLVKGEGQLGEILLPEGDRSLDKEALTPIVMELETENGRIQNLNASLREKSQGMSLKMKELEEKLTGEEWKESELKNQVEDLNWQLSKQIFQNDKLRHHIQDLTEKYTRLEQLHGSCSSGNEGDRKELLGLQVENEKLKDLANGRLVELKHLHLTQLESLKELEILGLDIRQLPESVIVETAEFKCLQSRFSVLVNDNLQLRACLDDAKQRLYATRTSHLTQIEEADNEEILVQTKLKSEMKELEESLGEVRKEQEMLRVELAQNEAASEQTGPMNQEMRHLITSLQNHNQQLERDAHRYRNKFKEACVENAKLKKKEKEDPELEPEVKRVKKSDRSEEEGIVRELRSQLKIVLNGGREMTLLLDMYQKGATKDEQDRVQMMASERRSKEELNELKRTLIKLQNKKEEKVKGGTAEEDAMLMKRMKTLEGQVDTLQKQVTGQKQEAEALIGEMEVTGQAFQDMQEHTSRLIQQLREKDDANFKLVSDRIKGAHLEKLAREERELLAEQVAIRSRQVEAQNEVVKKLEEKERVLLTCMASMEKEAGLRQQVMELYKRKWMESTQVAADLKVTLDKIRIQMGEVKESIAEKTCALETEVYKTRRLQEEMTALRRKVERFRNSNGMEMSGDTDQILMEEEIREYEEMLTCPACKVRRKDAVLIKCFHVFCFDCLRTRYEMGQRKCPKCKEAFGANDYHRLYLT